MNELMNAVMQDGFVMFDLALYLDTHPDCQDGLRARREAQERYAASRAAYERACGPLSLNAAGEGDCWNWVQRPWPWEED